MPIYEFTCSDCNDQFELLVRGEDTPVCPSCQGSHLEKQFSVPAVGRTASGNLPMADAGGCGAPQCQSGCQFE